jgi:hypothetical protein
MNGVLTVLYIRNYLKWKSDDRSERGTPGGEMGDKLRNPLLEIHTSGLYGLA